MYRPAGSYLFKVNNGNAIKMSEIYAKLIKKILERCQWHCTVFIVNSERNSLFSSVFIANFENVFACWAIGILMVPGPVYE